MGEQREIKPGIERGEVAVMVGCWMTGLERPADIREEQDDIIPAGYFSFSPTGFSLLFFFLFFLDAGSSAD